MSVSDDDKAEAAAVAQLAKQAAEVRELEPGKVYAALDEGGEIGFHDTDNWAGSPRRAKASRVVTDAASFVVYVNRHKLPGTEVFADTPASTVVAVIDSHEGTGKPAGWQSHRLTLSLEHTKAWKAWMAHDLGQDPNRWFGQQEFAEFIEDRALDVIEPDQARLIDIATKFEAKKSADFGSAIRMDSGEVRFNYTETIKASVGQKGSLEIPKQLKLALRPYIGGPIYYLFAQFRYRISGNGLRLGYAIERPENILEAAFADIVTEIREGRTDKDPETKEDTVVHEGIRDVPVFMGRP